MKDKNNINKYVNYIGRFIAVMGGVLAILRIIPHNSLIQYLLLITGAILIILSSDRIQLFK
jgi:hypothetical protein